VLLDRESAAHSVPQLTVITHTQFVFPSFVDVSFRCCFLLFPYTTVSDSHGYGQFFICVSFVRRHILLTDMSHQSRSCATTDAKHVTPQDMKKEKGNGIMTTVNLHTSHARFQDAYLDKCEGETPQFRAALQSDALTARPAGRGHAPAQPLPFAWHPDDDPLRTALNTLMDCFRCQCVGAWGFNAATALLCVVLAMQPSLLRLWWHLPLPLWTGIGACHVVVVFVLTTKSDATGTCEACRRILHRRMQQ
jgi:hypothetical protein